MIPAGEVYQHDNVRWYNYKDLSAHIDHYHNIGDAFVYDSSLKLLNFDVLDVVKIANPTDTDIARYNAEFDYVFLRASNYIHPAMKWEQAVPVLEKLKIPVVVFGIGAQAPSRGPLTLSAETKRVLRLIADSTTSVGVRGAYTAEVLWDIGIKNVRIVGCPTAFRRNNPELRIDLPPLETVQRVGVTLRREVSPAYAQQVGRYLSLHRELVKAMAARFDVELMAQGEVEEKKLVLGTPEQKAAALAQLRARPDAKYYFDETMLALYQTRLFYSDVVADYEQLVRTKDLVLGYRLHGNLMALANGVPAVYFTYDSRTSEFAETFAIPSFDVFADKPFRLEDFWDQALFEKFNRAFYQRYRDMRDFFIENGIDHKMPKDDAGRSLPPARERKVA
jgi:hypothetical protein